MRYICQLDYEHISYVTGTELTGEDKLDGEKTTVKSSGCGLCSSIMVVDRLLVDYKFDLEDAIKLSYSAKANYTYGTSLKRLGPKLAEKFNLEYEESSDSERLVYCLQTGGAVIANVGGDREGHIGVFSHGGHYIAVIGIEKDGRLAILDPSYKEGKYLEEGRIGKVELKNGVIALCDVQTLKEDTANRTPSYYLFWRK